MINLELTEKEKMLIDFLRESNELPENMLLWYSTGIENSNEKIKKAFEKEGWDPEPQIRQHSFFFEIYLKI